MLGYFITSVFLPIFYTVVGQSDMKIVFRICIQIAQHNGNRFFKSIIISLNPNEYQRCLGMIDQLSYRGLRKTSHWTAKVLVQTRTQIFYF